MSARGKKSGMVRQGETMVLQSETTVISVDKNDRLSVAVDQAVRFLRCNCPSVQISIHEGYLLVDDSSDSTRLRMNRAEEEVQTNLSMLQKHGEKFQSEMSHRGSVTSPRLIITITRTVAPKTEETTFFGIEPGDEVLIDGKRWLTVDILKVGDTRTIVCLDGESRGSYLIIQAHQLSTSVKKILD